MYVRMYVCMYVCMHAACMYVSMYACMYICMCKYKDLVSQCRKAGWRTELFTIQVGSRVLIDQESFEGLTNFTGVKTKDA